MALQEIGFVRIKTLPPRPPCTNPPKPAQPYENRHRSRHHQLRPRLHRRTRHTHSRHPPIHISEPPHLVAPGRTEPRRTLPSFLFLEDGQPVGVYAREQGALVPTKLV